jgi:hypothetical protein
VPLEILLAIGLDEPGGPVHNLKGIGDSLEEVHFSRTSLQDILGIAQMAKETYWVKAQAHYPDLSISSPYFSPSRAAVALRSLLLEFIFDFALQHTDSNGNCIFRQC